MDAHCTALVSRLGRLDDAEAAAQAARVVSTLAVDLGGFRPAISPTSTGGVAAIGEVARSSSPQRPAARPVATPATTRRWTSSPSSAGAAKSSQPIVAEPKSTCCSSGSGRPIVGGVADRSAFIVGSTCRSPQTRITSSTTSRTSPAVSHDRGATPATRPVMARQAPAINATSARSLAQASGRSHATAYSGGTQSAGNQGSRQPAPCRRPPRVGESRLPRARSESPLLRRSVRP
jgi:hypothetical protein